MTARFFPSSNSASASLFFTHKYKSTIILKIKSSLSSTGNNQETLNDAKAAINLEPIFIKPIVKGKASFYGGFCLHFGSVCVLDILS